MNADGIASIERATLAAVSPETLEEREGWLLPVDSGTVGRAKSAVPLQHTSCDLRVIEWIEAYYAEKGFPAIFRVATAPCFDALRRELRKRGYSAHKPTLVQVGTVQHMRQVSGQPPAACADAPDAAWTALFLGEGFDPVDGASRVKTLSRARDSVYAGISGGAAVLAGGAAAFGHGWASVHGMRTAQSHRGQGLAGRVLAGLADAAASRGIERVFLQVEAANTAAQALYRRAGFTTAWRYDYWQRL
ncbi:MAG TPA: GNAT family N-acetyltransferase [Polaromonas sp.]|uniref:GNAT family N-acetyltransferase n=1 Tax=Polaromonas sp. TaxID=1869339 RepID=UPI002D3152B3|nr:GNAT family N-acetyltransferase [Polaromonas sp.]HYW57262.1 GNAT family N-acetyltransferase [Polaromonas sp.]